MPDDQNNYGNDENQDGYPVDPMHHFQVDIPFGIGLPFAKNIDIGEKFSPDHFTTTTKN